jgi:hypothetical protein
MLLLIESLGGTALATFGRMPTGAYIVEQRTPNGYTSRTQLEATALIAGPQLAISTMPRLLMTCTPGEEVSYLTLHLNNDHYGAKIVSMKFSPPPEDFVEPGLDEGRWWQIITETSAFPLTHTYQLNDDATFQCLHYCGGIWTPLSGSLTKKIE